MKPITYEEARELVLGCDAIFVSQEQFKIYYESFLDHDIVLKPYLTHGCLAVYDEKCWHIHALSADSDLMSAISEVKDTRSSDTGEIMVLTWKNIPDDLNNCPGSYKLARKYAPYEDALIRPLTKDDESQIFACCAPDHEDNRIGQGIAEDFLDIYKSDPDYILGNTLALFENGEMLGFVTADPMMVRDGITTINIYVNRLHRCKGYAKRLLNAICARRKDTTYCYSCVKTNKASYNTAKSCGFEFMGAYLFIE